MNSGRYANSFESQAAARVSITIASVRFDLLTPDPGLEARLRRYFAEYQTSGPAQAELWIEPITAADQDAAFRPIWPIWEDEDPEFHQRDGAVVQRDFAARRVPRQNPGDPHRGLALVNGEVDDSFHNLLRWFAPRVLLAQSCFLLHGAGIVRDGQGYVFFGQSGAGKSTSSGLVRASDERALLVGDDAVIIQLDRVRGPLLHSAPLGCGYSRVAPAPLSVPLRGLFSLRQASQNRIERLQASQGVAALLASAMNTSSGEDLDPRFDLALRFAESRVGIEALHFTPDPAFWPLVLNASSNRRTHVETIG